MKPTKRFGPQSIRSRLALYFTFTFGVTLVLTSALCFRIFVNSFQQNFDASLYNHAIDVASAIDLGNYGAIEMHPFTAEEGRKHVPFAVSRSYLELRDAGGRYLASSPNLAPPNQLPFSDQIRSHVLTNGVDYTTIQGGDVGEEGGTDFRLISYAVNKPGIYPIILQIAVPMTIIQQNNKTFLTLLLFLIPTGIIISTFLALWASRRAFSPVLVMTKQTSEMDVNNLKGRIQVIENDVELLALGRTLNSLLDRVEDSMLAQDRFVADASHQLKTPLAIIQGELELLSAQYKNRTEIPGLQGELSSIKEEVAQLIRLVENLLLLAKMDAGHGSVPFRNVRLDEIVSESVKRFTRVTEAAGQKLSIELIPFAENSDTQIDFEIQGDAYLLRCLIENLLDNAIKYSKGAQEGVSVRLTEFKNYFSIEVTDHGLGITQEEISALFQRFKRDPKKSLEAQGSGLGLVIVKRIAELHGGTIALFSEPGRQTTARVELRKS